MRKKTIIPTLFLFSIFLVQVSCSEKRDPVTVSTHPDGWVSPSSSNFHGKLVLSTSSEGCKSCHGSDFSGGSSGVACAQCHELFPHPEGFRDPADADFHGKFIATKLKWDIIPCQGCHGTDYSGGSSGSSCLTCHTEENGPEACNTCHGSDQSSAPPKDLQGNQATSAVGVGAHQAHLNDSTYTTFYPRDCRICHRMPLLYGSEGHIDSSPNSEVIFGLFATDSGKVQPHWSHQNATCDNVYCHGAFTFKKSESTNSWAYTDSVITGNYLIMNWINVGAEQDSCGSCHGLPPTGHLVVTDCAGCHGRVVDGELNIVNKKLHIDGEIEIF